METCCFLGTLVTSPSWKVHLCPNHIRLIINIPMNLHKEIFTQWETLPYAVYLSASGLTKPINTVLVLSWGNRSFATSLSLVSTNWISLSDFAAFTNSLYSEPWGKQPNKQQDINNYISKQVYILFTVFRYQVTSNLWNRPTTKVWYLFRNIWASSSVLTVMMGEPVFFCTQMTISSLNTRTHWTTNLSEIP